MTVACEGYEALFLYLSTAQRGAARPHWDGLGECGEVQDARSLRLEA